jgi:hypothetical protein
MVCRLFLELKNMAQGFGRRYPHGRLSGDDDGEIAIGIASDLENKVVRMKFGKPVAWLAMDKDTAIVMLTNLAKHISRTFGVVVSVKVEDEGAKD